MSLQFILGGSGRGKTYYIQHMAVDGAFKNPQKEYIIIVPEQFTMQTQKELVELSPGKGIMNIDVQSFLRLAFRVFTELGAGNEPVLDDMGKTMILKKVLLDRQDELGYFGRNIHKKGYITEIKSFLSELVQYGIDDEMLGRMIGSAEKKPALKQKLEDMAVAYRAFLNYINNNYITSEEVITVFSEIANMSEIIKGSVIFLDGFTGFTPLQYKLLAELMKAAEKVYVTVSIDASEPVTSEGAKHRLFHMSRKTICKLRDIAYANNIEVLDNIWTGLSEDKSRYAKAPSLSALEKNLFRYNVKKYSNPAEISIHLLKQPGDEVSFIIQEINHLLREEKCRYKDIAVIAGDLQAYGIIIDNEMKQAGLPCFIDQKKSVLSNPFVDSIDAVLDVLIKDFAYKDVMRYLKGSFAGINKEQADIMDNFILATGIRGHKKWGKEWDSGYVYQRRTAESKEYADSVINDVREKVAEVLLPLYKETVPKKHTVRHFAEVFCNFFEEQGFYRFIMEKADLFTEQGELALAGEYGQIYGIVLSVFDRLVELLGDEEMKLSEFKELLDTGFSEARIGLIPPGTDQIVAGDISRTRISGIKYLFFIGVNDINIPKGNSGGGILSDSERTFLSGEEFEIAPTSRELVYQEQFYLYLNMTKPSSHLYITYCETGNDGRAQNPSYIIERFIKMFPGLSIRTEETRNDAEHILSNDMGLKYLINGLRKADYSGSQWGELYKFYLVNKDYKTMLGRLVNASFYREIKSKISQKAAKALYNEVFRGSTSQLERYAACAFSYFAQYGLRLEERAEHKVEFFDIGNIVHEALQLYTDRLLKNGKQWWELTEEEQHKQADECLDEAAGKYKNSLMYETERDTYMLTRLRKLLNRTVWAVTEQMKLGKFDTIKSEFKFDITEDNDNIKDNKKDIIHLIGRIDRIDEHKDDKCTYLKIVDYKTGKKDMSLSDLYYGLQMQLVIYLKAAMEAADETKLVIPAGVLYYNIADPVIEGKPDKSQVEVEMLKSLKMRGIVNEDDPVIPLLDANFETDTGELPVKVSSVIAPFGTDKDGNLKKASQVITTKDFDNIISYTQKNIVNMGKEIMDGRTEAYPYRKNDTEGRTACDYCGYRDICRFDVRIPGNSFRVLSKLSDDDVLNKIQEPEDNNK